MPVGNPDLDRDVVTEDDSDIRAPRRFHVILRNDNYTTTAFVVAVLETVFHHSSEAANQLMLEVHHKGRARVGTYSHEIAETKAAETTAMARKNNFPLRCTLEPAN